MIDYINAGVGDYGRSLRGDAEIAFEVGQRPKQKHQYSVETPCLRNSVCGCLGLLQRLNPIFGETTIPRHDHAAVQQRRGDDEAVGGILVNLRQRRGVKHDGVIERQFLHAVLPDEHVGEPAGRDGDFQLTFLHLSGNLPN